MRTYYYIVCKKCHAKADSMSEKSILLQDIYEFLKRHYLEKGCDVSYFEFKTDEKIAEEDVNYYPNTKYTDESTY
jgi:hypothetical protein